MGGKKGKEKHHTNIILPDEREPAEGGEVGRGWERNNFFVGRKFDEGSAGFEWNSQRRSLLSPELDKFSIRSLIGRLFHPLLFAKKNSLTPDLGFRAPHHTTPSSSPSPLVWPDIPAHIPRLSMYSRVIDRVRLSFFAYLTFRPGLSSVR